MTRGLQDRVILISGGGSGLGRATACRLAASGATAVVGDIEEVGGAAVATHLDVTDSASARAAVREAYQQFGERFDGLVNNAGTDRGAGILDLSDEQWHKVIGTQEREFPADVVNVVSISAITVGTDAAAYNSSKAALAMLTRIMQREAHEYRWPVRVHGLMPSAMNTPMMEQWHLADEVMMDPDTVAAAVEFMITLPPDSFVQNLVINSRREPGWPR